MLWKHDTKEEAEGLKRGVTLLFEHHPNLQNKRDKQWVNIINGGATTMQITKGVDSKFGWNIAPSENMGCICQTENSSKQVVYVLWPL